MILCLVFSIGAQAQFSGSGNGTEADPYRIYTEVHFAQMANFLNQEGVVFELMKDVDLSSYIAENSPSQGWTPIGVEPTPFKGVLKGNGHTVSGLMINRPANNNIGLFGYMTGATVTDLTVKATSITGSTNVGTLAGYVSGTSFTNCSVNVSSANGVKASDYIGGMVGRSLSSTFTNCEYTGNINATGSTGYAGGLIGHATTGSLTDCSITSTVNAKAYCGGAIGSADGINITNVTMHGNVSGTTSVGGIVGYATNGATWTNVNHYGDVVGSANVAGVVGELSGASVNFVSVYSKGKITNTGDYTGGIIAKSNGGCIAGMENCSHFGDVEGKNYIGGMVGAILTSAAAPTLHTYYLSSSSTVNTKREGPFHDSIVTASSKTNSINNCTAIGNIYGSEYIGGMIGKDEVANRYTSLSIIVSSTEYYIWIDGTYSGSYNYGCKTTYTMYETCIHLCNSFYSGNINGTINVGGLIGHKQGGSVTNSYAYATITGESNVGGIAGTVTGIKAYYDLPEKTLTLKSNVAINPSIAATASNVGRIYGSRGEAVTIGALGSAESNRALVQTNVILSGIAQDVVDDEQNGTSVGPSMLKLKANYVSWGWDFNEDWNILETESYPYKKYQAAPPVIKSNLESQDVTISGQSLDGGTVYMFYKDRDAVSTQCIGHDWTFNTEKLQSGAQVQLYADVEGLTPSYFTTAIVKYPGAGTEENPYRIYTAEDLQGASNSGYYKLMNDIDLTSWINENSPEKGWVAIGRNSSAATYIDGDGHKVTGLWIDTTEGYNGLFSNYSAGYIKNLSVEVANGRKVKGGDYTGILIGRMANGQIENCSVKGDVEGAEHTGGVVGYMENASLSANNVEAKVNSTADNAYVGGVVGHAKSVETTSITANATVTTSGVSACVGGMFGYAEEGRIANCTANATVTATGTDNNVGGLAGKSSATIDQSNTLGTVVCSGANSYAGGLVGIAYNAITNSYSTANTTGTEFTAGLAGYTYSSIDKCYAKGDVNGVKYGAGLVSYLDGSEAKASNSVAANNTINLTDQSSWGCRVIGGFRNGAVEPTLGSNLALGTMQVSLNNVPQKKTDDSIEGVAKTENELKSASTYTALGWDMTDIWGILELNSYPFLQVNKPSTPSNPDDGQDDNPGAETADYLLSITPVSTTAGSEISISVNMENKNDINGFQFDIVLPEGITIPKTAKGKYIINLGERGDDHTFSSSLRADGSVRVICTSLSNAVFEGNSGEICVIPLVLDNSLINGNYAVQLKNIALSDTESTNIEASDIEGVISVVNDYITSSSTEALVGKPFDLSLNLINKSTDLCGLQFDVEMPAGISLAKNAQGKYLIKLTDRGDDHVFSTLDRGENVVRVVCSSLSNSVFDGTEGALCTLTFVSESGMADGEHEINFTNIRLSNTASVDIPVGNSKSTVVLKSFTPGDVNNDGIISVADVTAAISFVLESPQPTFIRDAADMDGNGEIKVNDVTAVISLVLSDDGSQPKSISRNASPKFNAGSSVASVLYIEPFAIEPGETKDINIMLDNPDLVSIGWQADIYLPEGLSFPLSKRGKYQTAFVEERTDEYSITSQLMSDGAVRVVGVSMDNYEIEGTSGAIMTIKVTASSDLNAGVYTASVKKVSLSDELSNDVPLVNTDYSVLSGNLSTIASLTLPGGWTEDAIDMLNGKLDGNTTIGSIDMSEAIYVADKSINAMNPNTLVFVPSFTTMTSTNNVVFGEECANLTLTDGYAFATSKAFTATNASYERTVANSWGTIMLPYAVQSNEAVTYYQLKDVDMTNGILSFEQVESVEANVPAVFKATGAKLEANAENVNIPVCGGDAEDTTVGGLTLVGSLGGKTYESLDPAAADGVYFIRSNKFWRGEGNVVVSPFRACFEVTSVSAMSFALRDLTETGIHEVEAAEAGTEIYDLNGIYMGTDAKILPAGFYIVNGKKVIIKQ